jgi:hypothetical protein
MNVNLKADLRQMSLSAKTAVTILCFLAALVSAWVVVYGIPRLIYGPL